MEMHPKNYNGIIGMLQKKREIYQPIAIGDIRNVSDEIWAAHWRPHGSGWQDPRPNNICYLERAYGGSDMSAIMGVSHFKTRLELFHQKIGQKTVFTRNGNAAAKELGHLYETPTAMKYHMLRRKSNEKCTMFVEGKVVEPDGSIRKNPDDTLYDNPISMQMYRDGRLKTSAYQTNSDFLYPWALANCDGFLMEEINGRTVQGILEIKTTSPMNYDVIEGWKNGIVPEGYFWQCVYYMAILNVMYCDICCSWEQTLEGTAIIRIYRDYDIEEKLFHAVAEFDEFVEQCIEPDTMFDDGTLLNNYYYELFGPANEKAPMIELPEKYRGTVMRAIDIENECQQLEKALKEAEAKREKIYSELYPIFKTSSYGQFRIDNTHVAGITLKTPMKRAKLDEERFKQDYPALYEECKVFSCTELGNYDKKLKAKYMLPAEPDTEDKTKHPSFKLKILERELKTI